jgi:endonuclease/exonuclease/phosphatase (EEP) superfamily protein YafD
MIGRELRGAALLAAIAGSAILTLALIGATIGRAVLFLSTAGHLVTPSATIGAIAAILFLLARKPIGAMITGALVAGALFLVWPRTIIEPCPAGTPTHRVVFYNVWASNPHPEATIRFLAATNADVIVLAEVRDSIQPALEGLRATYPYRIEQLGARTIGTVLLARVPLENLIETIRQPGGRGSLVPAILSFPEGKVSIAGAHLTRPWPFGRLGSHERQSSRLADAFAAMGAPRLLVGDLNAVTWSHAVRTIEARSGARAMQTWGSWPATLPLPLRLPIDQAILGPGILCAKKTVGPPTGSDHRPIILDFALSQS